MTERIHKAYGLEKDFLTLRNKDVQRKDLSFEAIGILVYLLSLPTTWEIHLSTLERKGMGRDKIRRAIKELTDKGYMALVKTQNEKGLFEGSHYEIFAIPEANPNRETEKPSVGENRVSENPQLEIKDIKKKRKESTPKERDRLFDGVSLLCFNINAEDEKQKEALGANASRIGQIVSYLKKVDSTPEKLWTFKKWYCSKYPNMDMPNDLAKFTKHYNDFASTAPLSTQAAANIIFTPPQATVSDSEQADALSILRAKREEISS